MLIVGRGSPEWKEAAREYRERFEMMAARILNEGFEESIMKCNMGCGREMNTDWNYCPFCGHQRTFTPEKLQTTANEQSTQGQYEKVAEDISSEEDQFNSAIKTVRETFDKLKRVRKSRDKAEEGLKEAIGKIHERDSRIHLLQQEVGRIRTPQPMAIRNVYGQVGDRHTQEVLGILKIEQSYPTCDITVRLPR